VRGMNEDDDEGAQARRYTAEALNIKALEATDFSERLDKLERMTNR
jgi:hypothetical protein